MERPDTDPDRARLVDSARQALRRQAMRAVWRDVDAGAGAIDPVPWLRRAGFRALDRLLAQQRGPGQDGD